jgi:hypothetical protein
MAERQGRSPARWHNGTPINTLLDENKAFSYEAVLNHNWLTMNIAGMSGC